MVVAFGRTALGALLLLPFALRSKALRPLLTHWRWLLLYTVVEIGGPWVLLGHAEHPDQLDRWSADRHGANRVLSS